jgi:hypothetical protein
LLFFLHIIDAGHAEDFSAGFANNFLEGGGK